MEKVRRVRLRNIIAYGMCDLDGNGPFVIINLLFIFFPADVIGPCCLCFYKHMHKLMWTNTGNNEKIITDNNHVRGSGRIPY